MITDLEPDILECEVKCALKSITMNKASGDDRIPVELFQILKDDAVKMCTQYASKFGKLSSGNRTGKGQFSSNPKERQCQRMLKNQSSIQLELVHKHLCQIRTPNRPFWQRIRFMTYTIKLIYLMHIDFISLQL